MRRASIIRTLVSRYRRLALRRRRRASGRPRFRGMSSRRRRALPKVGRAPSDVRRAAPGLGHSASGVGRASPKVGRAFPEVWGAFLSVGRAFADARRAVAGSLSGGRAAPLVHESLQLGRRQPHLAVQLGDVHAQLLVVELLHSRGPERDPFRFEVVFRRIFTLCNVNFVNTSMNKFYLFLMFMKVEETLAVEENFTKRCG